MRSHVEKGDVLGWTMSTRGNYKAIRNKGFRSYLNKFQKINSADKGGLQLRSQEVFLHCMLVIQAQYTELKFLDE